MRKILLFLLTLVTMMAQAQMEKTATFDFNHPLTLNPAVTPSPVPLNEVGLNNYTFTANDVTLDFGAQSGYESYMNVILTTNDDFSHSHSMGFNDRSTMIISVPSSSYITKIEMGIANINISPNVGTYDPVSFTWTASNKSTSKVVFSNPHTNYPTIQYVTVHYVAPSAIMDYSSASIIDADNQSNWYSDGVDVTSFKSFDIDFPKNVSLLSSSGITMTDKNDANIPFTASCSGSKLSLTPDTPITEDDDITIYVPANVVQSSDNLQNKELGTFNFKVRKERETFNYTATDPAEGDVVELPKTIKVTFPKAATLVDDGSKPIKMYKDGDYQYSITLSQDPDNKAIIWLVNNVITGPITNTDANQGVWTIKIPAGLIHTTAYRANVLDTDDYWNEETTLTWTIIPTPDPLQPKKDRVAELQATATQLYAQIGQLGYPTADSGSPTLFSVKGAAVADTDEALDTQITTLENAIKAFYAVTDVAMPSAKTSDTDGWYAFYSVDANGSEKAIHYENGDVSFVGGATMFQVQSVSGPSVALKTVEGESLTVTLTKMLLTGTEADQSTVAGLFAVTGIDDVTCVRLEEGSKPQATLVYPTAFLLGESAPDNTKRLTLLVVGRDQNSDVTKVSLNGSATADQLPYFAKRTGLDVGDKVTSFTGDAILTKSANYDNNGFEVHLDGMESGDYWLIMPKGCFDYSANPKTVTELDDPLKVSFTIQGSGSGSGGGDDSGSGSGSGDDSGSGSGSSTDTSDFRYDLLYYHYPSAGQEEPIKATDLNQAGVRILRAQYGDMCVDDTKTVTLSDGYGKTYRSGKLVRDDDYMAENPAYSAYRVEWDTPLTEEDFPNSKMVSLKIPVATFGNANFGQWLANPNSVKKSDCIVNQGAPKYYTIDNARAEDAETAEDRAAFDTYKATKIAEADGKAELGQSQACADLIDNAKAAINNLVYDKTLNLAANKARVDAIITQLNADLSTQRAKEDALAAFVTHKNAQKAAAQAMAKADDSAASKALITKAVAAIEAVTYDEDKSLAENKAPIDAIITKLNTDLATQRAKDAAAEQLVKDKAAFAEYKVTQKAAADALGQEGDSDACKKLISDAKALIDGMTFDESKSLAMNKIPIDATIQKLATDLVAQRDIEKSKAALKALIDEAKAYAESIKTSHPAVATMLNGAIATAEAKYNEQTATKAEFDTAKDTLSVMLEAAKSASTGISELTIPDSVKGDFYTLDGRKLDGKPTKKGVYIVNGRKVVIK